ncbi:MAG TPA: Holliday junction branch migration protein RuvA [Coriobacteriia bacterium]|nr:Holliday junction branch migration protein RuvA [Coriobacteriia bacterium]
MIESITGRIASKAATHCVVDVGGVGVRLAMPTGSLALLPYEGDIVTLFAYLHVRQDEWSLFGFQSAAERELFERLITVSGVGPKVALAALSSLDPEGLAHAICGEDVAAISSVPGIGTKTAQRIILELKEKLAVPTGAALHAEVGRGALAEAREVLVGMGFSAAEAAGALKGLQGSDVSALVRAALRRLGGGSE